MPLAQRYRYAPANAREPLEIDPRESIAK